MLDTILIHNGDLLHGCVSKQYITMRLIQSLARQRVLVL